MSITVRQSAVRPASKAAWGLAALCVAATVVALLPAADALCVTPMRGTGTQVVAEPCGDSTSGLGTDFSRVSAWEQGGDLVISHQFNIPFNQATIPTGGQIPAATLYRSQFGIWGAGGPQTGTCYSTFVDYQGGIGSLGTADLVSNQGCQLINTGFATPVPISMNVASFPSLVAGGAPRFCNEIDHIVPFTTVGSPAVGSQVTWGYWIGAPGNGFFSYAASSESNADGTLYDPVDDPLSGTYTIGTGGPVQQGAPSLTATVVGSTIVLSWVENDNLAQPTFEWRVYRSASGPPMPGAPVASVPYATTTWTDTSPTPGTTYTYWVTAVNCRGQSPAVPQTATVPIAPAPPTCAISPTTPLPRHPGQTVTFTASSGTPPYTWSTTPAGSPASGSGATFDASWSATGAKTVTVTDANNLQGTCAVEVTPWPPVACAPNPATVQVNVGITFTATGGDGTYAWSAPDGSPSSGAGANFLTQWSGDGPRLASVSSGGQTASCNVTVTLYPPLLCTPATQTVTSGGSTLDATGGDGTYSWSMPGGNPATFTGPTYTSTFTASGTYTATVSSAGQTATCSVTVAIPCGDVNAGFEPTADSPMVGQTVTFIDRSLGDVYSRQWDFGDGATSLDVNPAHEFYSPGEYHVRLTVVETGSGCTDSEELLVRVVTAYPVPQEQPAGAGGGGASAPIANAGPDQTVLEGQTVDLAGQATGISGDDVTYTWRLAAAPAGVDVPLSGSGARFNFVAPQVLNPDQPLDIVYELVVSRGGAISQGDAVTITVRSSDQRPSADAGREQEVERGMTAQLDGSRSRDPEGEPLQFTWTVIAGEATLQDAATATPSFVVPLEGTSPYADFQLTVSDGRWQHASSVRVWFKPAPVVPAGIAVEAVDDDTFRFSPGTDGRSYQWDFADGTTSTAATPEHTFQPGTHAVELVVTLADGRQEVFTTSVTVPGPQPSPDGSAGPEPASGGVSVLAWVLGIAGLLALAAGATIFLVMRRKGQAQ